ncbi:MAG: hypothetical protein ACTSU2_08915 [Promethearchaeota archaeon]
MKEKRHSAGWYVKPEKDFVTLKVNDKQIYLNKFTQEIFEAVNINVFGLLKKSDKAEEIKKFHLNMDLTKEKIRERMQLFVNDVKIPLMRFVEDIISGLNLAVINTLQDMPENITHIEMDYSRE